MTPEASGLASGPASPELNAALRARLERLLGEYDRVRDNLSQIQGRLRTAEGEAQSKDGGVRVTVGPRGDLRTLTIEPRACRRLSPSELAAEILELSRQAIRDVQRQLEQVMAPFLPAGVSYQQVADGQVDPASLAPRQPVTSESFDAWWSGIGGQPPEQQRGGTG